MSEIYSRLKLFDRRGFLRRASTATLAMAGLTRLSADSVAAAANITVSGPRVQLARNDVILFQGDSITDSGRKKSTASANDQSAMGVGYAWMATAELLLDRPQDGLKIYNRGVSGNKVFQLAERWEKDCLDLKPTVLSILIGVNDYWHTLDGKYGGTVQVYERDFSALLERTQKALPKVKVVICEPFVLRCGTVTDKWFPEFDNYRAAARRVADKYSTTFIPFQSMFEEALKYAPPIQLAKDGVHPTPAGASLMAHTWLKAVNG